MARTRQRKSKIDWYKEELDAWKPPEKLLVSDWADENIVLNEVESARPGKWKTDFTPYLREIMNQFSNSEVQETDLACAAQTGKSRTILNVLGYIVDQDPGPTLIVYPDKKLAEWSSENRIQPMLRSCEKLVKKFKDRESEKTELKFDSMYIALVGAHSPAALASRPVRYVLIDETDKFPGESNKEADPVSLAEERTKTFYNKKIFKLSTPTLEHGVIWQTILRADIIKQYFVPCPHCGEYQTFKLKQLKWPNELNELPIEEQIRKVRTSAFYTCEFCGHKIYDRHKDDMLIKGEWRPVKYIDGSFEPAEYPDGIIRKVAYQLSSMYAPWIPFGEIAEKFLESKDFPEKLRNFINSWLGEPWRDKTNTMRSDVVLEKQWVHESGEVPEGAVILTAGVDVQQDHFWYTIRAWGEGITSWLVDYGRVECWADIEKRIVNGEYYNKKGQKFVVNLAGIDSGYDTEEVYQFCLQYPDVCVPVKGDSKPSTEKPGYRVFNVDKSKYTGLKLWIVNGDRYKNFISGRLQKRSGERGAWMVYKGCDRLYADHIASEQKIIEQDKKTGRVKEEWRKISSHAQNHLLDCEVYATAMAEQCGIRSFGVGNTQSKSQHQEAVDRDKEPSNQKNWIPDVDW